MPWQFIQDAGEMLKDGGLADGDCYSGHGIGFNNPEAEEVHDVGPIPAGEWTIKELIEHHGTHGPYVLRLEPKPGTNTFGRSGFLMHGKPKAPADIKSGSHGCICGSYATRMRIWLSADRDLEVLATRQSLDTKEHIQ